MEPVSERSAAVTTESVPQPLGAEQGPAQRAASPSGLGSLVPTPPPPAPPGDGQGGPGGAAPKERAAFNSYDPVSKRWLSAGDDVGSALWDGKKKAAAEPGAVVGGDIKADERGFGGLAFSADERRVAEVKLNGGQISRADLAGLDLSTVKAIDPQSAVPAKILQSALDESWHVAKAELTTGDGNIAERKTLMKKLWEFRQWDHEQVLQLVRAKLPKAGQDPSTLASPYPGLDYKGYFPAPSPLGRDALTEWAAAGSTTLTSDIDVNLKGDATELAVPAFNQEFKAARSGFKFNREPGVTYDVNVYAMDFMHGAGVEVDAAGGKQLATSQEFGAEVMGRKGNTDAVVGRKGLDDLTVRKADADDQEVWAHVKVRRYMTAEEWVEYKNDIIAAGHARDDLAGAQAVALMTQAEGRFNTWRQTMLNEMVSAFAVFERDADEISALAAAGGKSGVQELDAAAHFAQDGLPGPSHGKVEDRQMAASNRIYERKLQQIAQLRRSCRRLQSELGGGGRPVPEVKAELDAQYAALREALSEASLYANEAYVTDGAVNHTVVGLQIGRPLQQDKRAILNAVIENHADVRKEVARHGSWLGEAAYKAGKYMWRLGDAARNLGVDESDVDPVYGAGFDIANKVKGGAGSPEELSADAVEENMGVVGAPGRPDGIAELIGQVDGLAKRSQHRVKELTADRQLAPAKATSKDDRRAAASAGAETVS
jgi:hypothetical protein